MGRTPKIPSVKKKQKQVTVYVVRRSIFIIFIFFSALVMVVCFGVLVIGLFTFRLKTIIEQGTEPPALINIAIMAETGSALSQDAMAQAMNDLVIVKGFTERLIETKLA